MAQNGYLPDHPTRFANKRTRSRFLLEITDAAISGGARHALDASLRHAIFPAHSISDSDPAALFSYVAKKLGERNIAFIFTRESIESKPMKICCNSPKNWT